MKKSCTLLAISIFLTVFLVACTKGSGVVNTTVSPIANPTSLTKQTDLPTILPNQTNLPNPTSDNATNTSNGPGNFDLSDTQVGLDGLNSYHQSLQTTFEGTINGEQQQSKTTLNQEVVDNPPTQLSWVEIGDQPVQFFGRVGSINYNQPSPDVTCLTSVVNDAGSMQAPTLYPLASLPPIRGAEFANEENINGVPAKHFTFDERAIGFADQATAQGEVWVASSGGYLLRYTLRLEAPADLLGPGVEGVQSWSYDLSEVNTGKTSLPGSCQQPQENASVPMLDGATVTTQQPGYLVYQVSGGVEAVMTFYQQQAETLGWSGGEPFQFGDVTRVSFRPEDGSLVQLTFEPKGDLLTVTVQTLAPMPAE
jgi:hypothetical protein